MSLRETVVIIAAFLLIGVVITLKPNQWLECFDKGGFMVQHYLGRMVCEQATDGGTK